MALYLSCFLLLSFLFTTNAFNITKILDQYSDYDVFNQELTRTHLAGEINKHKTVTVLVVPNAAMSNFTTQKDETIKDILMVHVVLDYYDSAKIKKLEEGTTMVTTLYQITGSAGKEEGVLKIHKNGNEIKFGSDVRVNKVVTSIDSEIAVIEISSPIMPSSSSSSSLSSLSEASSSPSSSPSESPAPSSDSPAPGPSEEHKHADSPSPSDEDADADAPSTHHADADEEDAKEAEKKDSSSSSRNSVVSSVMMILASFAATL